MDSLAHLNQAEAWGIVLQAASAFALCAIGILPMKRIALGRGIVAAREPDSSDSGVPLLGGVPIVGAILITLGIFWLRDFWEYLGVGGLLILGVWDDARPLSPLQKLAGQFFVIAAAVFAWPSPALTGMPWFDKIILIYWLLATVNAFNLIDGLDGLAAGIGIVAAAAIAGVAVINGKPALAGEALVIAGALGGFLVFNFHPASIFMGDAGALPIGFMLGVLSIEAAGATKLPLATRAAIPVLIMLMPLLDMTIVSISRIATNRAISRRGLDHSHHKLLSLGLPDRVAVGVCWMIGAISGSCALALATISSADAIMAMPFAIALFTLIGLFMVDVTFDTRDPGFTYENTRGVARLILNFGYKRRLAEAVLDLALITAAYFGAFLIRFDFNIDQERMAELLPNLPIVLAVSYVAFFSCGVYRGIWRYAGLPDVIRFGNAALIATILLVLVAHIFPVMLSGSIAVLFVILLFNLLMTSRLSFRAMRRGLAMLAQPARTILIIGANETAEAAARFIGSRGERTKVSGFIDVNGDVFKNGRLLQGAAVLGALDDLSAVCERTGCTELMIATDQIAPERMRELATFAQSNGLHVTHFSIGISTMEAEFAAREEIHETSGLSEASLPRRVVA